MTEQDQMRVVLKALKDAQTLGCGWMRANPDGTIDLFDPAAIYIDAEGIIEDQAAEIAALRDEKGVAVGALSRVADDGVSSLDRANARIAALREALTGLLADIEEYQQINNLGGKNNHWQVIARAALTHHAAQGD